MARKGRETSSLGMYHVILRGSNELFFEESDYNEFLLLLKKYFTGKNHVYAYSLDRDKIHLVIFTENTVSAVLKPLCTSYARYINRTHNKAGKLFYDRFLSIAIESLSELALAVRYTAKKPSHLSSLSEYKKKADICSVDSLSEKIALKSVAAPGIVYPSDDDYSSMTDSEVKQLICALFASKPTDGEAFSNYLAEAVKVSNLSMARLARIFKIKPIYKKSAAADKTGSGKKTVNQRKKTAVKKEKKSPEKQSKENREPVSEEKPRQKQELSVWLL